MLLLKRYCAALLISTVLPTPSSGPLTFQLGHGEVIRGWDYGASTMQKGERCILTVGPAYGYGASGSGPIPPNATLTFEMEMVGWDKPSVSHLPYYAAILAMICIVYYVLFVDDERDIVRKAQEL